MVFQPGQSGNPGGRPKVLADVQEAARARTAEAIDVLASIAIDPGAPPAARVSAANALLDRAWGKPQQTVQAKVERMTLEDLVMASMHSTDDSEKSDH